jgi:cobalt-zinc-cadmium efflux system outer membrane protein
MLSRILVYFIGLIGLLPNGAATAELVISYGEIRGYAIAHSPHAAIIEADFDHLLADRNASLQWSNPRLSWEWEQIGDGTVTLSEYTLLMEKEFSMPWHGRRSRAGWNLKVEAARHRNAAASWRLISSLRHGYIVIRLSELEMRYLAMLESLAANGSRIADERKREGALSGVERHLIQMSLLGIRRRIQEKREEHREEMIWWKTDMGIPGGTEVVFDDTLLLSREILGVSVAVGDTAGIDDLRSRQLDIEAIRYDVKAEKGGILPSMTLSGGYKNVEDSFEGFVIGISMPLPVLNRNTGAVNSARAAETIARRRLDLYRSARARRITRLADSAAEKAALLGLFIEQIAGVELQIDALSVSYREGWLTLTEFLEGIDIYAEGIENYFDLLEEYYAAVFELEALTERELVGRAIHESEETKL